MASSWRQLLRATLKDPMIWFLLGTSVAYALLGQAVEAAILLVAAVPLLLMDAVLHRRTQASTAALAGQLAVEVQVWRDGVLKTVPATSLVPGDRVRIDSGDSFPADGVLVAGAELQADEALLTGEAYPVAKQALRERPVSAGETPVWIDGRHWGFAGARLLTGTAELQVVFTGGQTLYGEIVRLATAPQRERTPLQTAIASLVSLLLVIAGVLCLILAVVRLRQGHDWVDAVVSAATLAVAALPEEFPVVFTVFLGVGVYRLARQQALVRRAVSVENIGRITCICADKTGTLTEGRLQLAQLVPAAPLQADELLGWSALAARRESQDSLDAAIFAAVTEPAASNVAVLANYPYTESRRRETTVLRRAGELMAVSKGAPEVLLPLSNLSAAERQDWSERVTALAGDGHKVLACLVWTLTDWVGGEPDRDGDWAGLLAFADPVRAGVVEAVQECRAAGIRVLMVTGDHPATAVSVARALGLPAGAVMVGEELERRLDNGEPHALDDLVVVARALPTQKLALVRALQAQGELVVVTGDGINDIPALQAADIGIAMGGRGSRSAREAAAIVLLDDNFATIVRAIAEGRQLFRNLQLSFQYLLLIHIPLVITATFIPLVGHPILYLPVHIVWLETLIHPTALLVFQELPRAGRLQPLARARAARFFSRREWGQLALSGGLITALILWAYDRSLAPGSNVEHARAMAMVVLCCSSAVATALLSGLRTRAAWWLTVATVLSAVVLVQLPGLAQALSLRALHGDDWLIAALGGGLAVALPFWLLQPRHSARP